MRDTAPSATGPVRGVLLRPTVQGVAVRATGLVLASLVTVVLARTLSAGQLGWYQAVMSAGAILAGLVVAVVERPAARRLSEFGADHPVHAPVVVGSAHLMAARCLVAVVAVVALAGAIPGIPRDTRAAVLAVALVVPFLALQSLRQWIALPRVGAARSIAPEQVAQPLVLLALCAAVAAAGELGPLDAVVVTVIAVSVVWLGGSWRSGMLRQLRQGLAPARAGLDVRAQWREGRPFVLLTAVGVVPVYATVPLVAALLSPADAGRFGVAFQLSALVAVPLQIGSLALMPRTVRLHRDGEMAELRRLVREACTIGLVFGASIAALLLVGTRVVLELFGSSFASARELVPVLIVGQLVNATLGPNGPTLQMLGFEREAARAETVATAVRLVAVVAAALAGSVLGVAWAITAATVLRNLLLSVTLHRRAGILTLPSVPGRHDRT